MRRRTPPRPSSQCSSAPSGGSLPGTRTKLIYGSVPELGHDALQLHRHAHVAFHAELALHKGRRRVELALGHRHEVLELDLDRGVSGAVVLAHLPGDAVEEDLALIAKIELHLLACHGDVAAGEAGCDVADTHR